MTEKRIGKEHLNEEGLKTEVKELLENVGALKNVITIIENAGLDALKTIFKK